MRPSSPDLAGAFAAGAATPAPTWCTIGLASTDQLYFASGDLGHPGAMFTASHNPARTTGSSSAAPAPSRSAWTPDWPRSATPSPAGEHPVARPAGHGLAARRARGVRRAPAQRWRRSRAAGCKVVVDAGNGMAGLTAPAVFERSAASRSSWSRCTSSSTAPSPTTRPTRSSRRTCVDLQARVVAEEADLGLAFDGDADRCFVVDERGRAVSPSTLTALIAARELRRGPGRDA